MMSEKARAIQAERIGGHAYRYLTARSCKGWVVSSFFGGINLLFEGGEAFVPVQTTDVPLHPWAIEIVGRALLFPEGTPVSAEEGDLLVGGTHIVLSAARIKELSLPRLSAKEAAIVWRNFPILARFMDEAQKTHAPDPFQPEIDAILRCWRESGEVEILLDLIGLGAGSTPSGDDVLVGIIAGISLFENVEPLKSDRLDQLRISIRRSVRGRTPFPSAQMLLAACELTFDEPILKLVAGLTSPNIQENNLLEKADRVFQLGHHSGLAILLGLTKSLRVHVMLYLPW